MDLVRSQTNSANDSSGSVWGLPGNTFIALVFSLVLSVGVLVITMGMGINSMICGLLASIPCGMTIGYLAVFVIGRPKNYAIDLVDILITGKGFSINPVYQPPHPFDINRYVSIDSTKRIFR
jgi:hypothetical protein